MSLDAAPQYKPSSRAIKVVKEAADLRAWLLLAAKEQYKASNRDIMRAFGIEHEGALFNALHRARKRRAQWEANKTEAARKHLESRNGLGDQT
jgi:hypothetical protein